MQPPSTPANSAPFNGQPQGVKAIMLQLAVRLGLTAVAVPVALAVTLLLYPVWSWLERTTGIESVGHSGPADWCYLAVWVPMAAALLLPPLWRLVLALWRGVEGPANTPH